MSPSDISRWADAILEMQTRLGQMEGRLGGVERQIDKLTTQVERLTEAVLSRMTPDRCAHLHLEVEKRLHQQIINSCKEVDRTLSGRAGLVARIVRDVLIIVAAAGGFSGMAAALGWLK